MIKTFEDLQADYDYALDKIEKLEEELSKCKEANKRAIEFIERSGVKNMEWEEVNYELLPIYTCTFSRRELLDLLKILEDRQ